MNVYFLTSHLRPHDGQSKAVLNFVKGLEKFNTKTQIIAFTSDITDHPNVINLKGKTDLLYSLKIFMGSPSPLKKFYEWLNDDEGIFIVANDDLVPVINYKRNKGKFIYWSQGALVSIFFWKNFYAKQKLTRSFASLFAVRNALKFSNYVAQYDKLLANSKTSATFVSLFYNRIPEGVIYPPLEVDEYHFNKNKEKFLLAILKRGYPTHVKLLEKIAQKAKLKVVGYKIDGAEYVGDRVSDEELKELYSSALITLYPYDFEYFGYIPVESMASGTPVLAFNYSGGPTETIINGETGWLASGEKEFYDIAVRMYNEGYEEKINENCKKRAEDFSIDRQTKNLYSMIEQYE